MVRFLTDEDFDAKIVQGLQRRLGDLDVLSVRDVGLASVGDPLILEWAARNQRSIVTHDVNTLVGFADERVRRGDHHAGVIRVPQTLAIGRAIEDLIYIAEVANLDDLKDQVLHLPL